MLTNVPRPILWHSGSHGKKLYHVSQTLSKPEVFGQLVGAEAPVTAIHVCLWVLTVMWRPPALCQDVNFPFSVKSVDFNPHL